MPAAGLPNIPFMLMGHKEKCGTRGWVQSKFRAQRPEMTMWSEQRPERHADSA
jgi:hypothetical protein